MLSRLATLATFAIALALVLVLAACAPGGRHGTLVETTIPAPSLAGSRFPNSPEQPAAIYLPPSYPSSGAAYPVVYYLPGFTTDVTEYLDGAFQGFNLREAMDRLIAAGTIGEMIVVVANGRNFLGGSFYANSPVTGNWEDFVVRDVVEYIDGRYRTIRSPDARGVAGESMGGFGALRLAMRHPGVFGCVYALSPGLFAPGGLDRQGIFAEDKVAARRMVAAELATLPAAKAAGRFRTLVGELYASGSRFNYYRAFGYAYGAAFAPDPGGPPPFIDYSSAGSRQRFEDGYGGLERKVALHAENLRHLGGIVIDYGRNDRLAWIPEGCEHFSRLLREAGIEHEVRAHDGGHIDRWRQRFETQALPFFSARLAREPR